MIEEKRKILENAEIPLLQLFTKRRIACKNLILHILLTGIFIFTLSPFTHGKKPARKGAKIEVMLSTSHSSTVFSPGQKLKLKLVINNHTDQVFSGIKYTARINGSKMPGSASATVDCHPGIHSFPINLPLPEKDGVYKAKCTLSGFADKEIKKEIRKHGNAVMEFVVIDPHKKTVRPAELKKVLVEEINCAAPPVSGQYLEFGDSTVKNSKLGTFRYTGSKGHHMFPARTPKVILPEHRSNISWFAYKLKIKELGKPHMLEISYPDDAWRVFGVSIFEGDLFGNLRGLQINSGVICGGRYPNSNTVRYHRIYFWPKSYKAAIVITNRLAGHRAAVGKIRLYRLPDGLPQCRIESTGKEGRHLGLFYEEAKAPHNFGGLTDKIKIRAKKYRNERRWNYFYKSALHLIDYMKFCGLDTIHYLSLGYDDAIYPSELLNHRSRYDDGHLASDPFRKDILEMYFSLFDRENLTFVPDIDTGVKFFNFENEMKRKGIPPTTYCCVDKNGNHYTPGTKSFYRGMKYEPLDPDWQNYIIKIIREIAERYKTHSSFKGIQMRVKGNSCIYTDLSYGYGDSVIKLFEKETGIKVPGGNTPDRFNKRYKYLTHNKKEEFIAWRCKKIADFLKRISSTLSSIQKDSKLFMGFYVSNFAPRFRDEDNWPILRDTGFDPKKYARNEKGLDISLLKDMNNIVILRYRRDGGDFVHHLLGKRGGWQYNHEKHFMEKYDNTVKVPGIATGVLSFYSYYESRLDDFVCKAQKNWFDKVQVWLVGTLVPTEPFELEPFAHAMNSYDPQYAIWGGFGAPMGREEDLRKFAKAYRSLPAVPFTKEDCSRQPVGIYIAQVDGKSWIYLANESYAPAKASLRLTCKTAGNIVINTGGSRKTVHADGKSVDVDIEIDGYSVAVLHSEKGKMLVDTADITAGKFYLDTLKDRCNQVKSILNRSKNPKIKQLAVKLNGLMQNKLWIDLWKALESAEIFDAVIACGIPKGKFYELNETH